MRGVVVGLIGNVIFFTGFLLFSIPYQTICQDKNLKPGTCFSKNLEYTIPGLLLLFIGLLVTFYSLQVH